MRLITLLLTLALIGCTGREYKLEPEFRPLLSIKEGNDNILASDLITTIGHHVYTSDLEGLLDVYTPGSRHFNALLKHERLHSIRQLSYKHGIGVWLFNYVTSPSFRWDEEKIGHREEIRLLTASGLSVDADGFAKHLNKNYQVLGVPMVDYDEAKRWVQAVVEGRE